MDDSVLDESPDGDDAIGAGDSAIVGADDQPRLLQVYETGPTTVVGFGGIRIPVDHNVAAYRDELLVLIAAHDVEELAFDLTSVPFVPSGIVGLMATLHGRGVRVALLNASPGVREVFQITKLDQFVAFREVETRAG